MGFPIWYAREKLEKARSIRARRSSMARHSLIPLNPDWVKDDEGQDVRASMRPRSSRSIGTRWRGNEIRSQVTRRVQMDEERGLLGDKSVPLQFSSLDDRSSIFQLSQMTSFNHAFARLLSLIANLKHQEPGFSHTVPLPLCLRTGNDGIRILPSRHWHWIAIVRYDERKRLAS